MSEPNPNRELGLEEERESPQPYPGDELDLELSDEAVELEPKIGAETIEGLASHLVWKLGKEEGSERVVVRVGYASATSSFAELPRLRGATDAELAEAARTGDLVVEWID